jgi:hypothetical protein
MYVNNVQKNWLQRVEKGDDGRFARLVPVATSLPLSGPDGLRSIGGNRFLQAEGAGGRVSLLTIEDDRAQLLPLATGLDTPASVAMVGNIAWVPEGKTAYLFDAARSGQDPGPFTVRPFAIQGGR